MKNARQTTKNFVLAAMFMALGLVLPFLTGQIQQIGNMLLPMHLPVLVCGLICGWQYGAVVGFVLPLLRFVLFGMPPIYPMGVSMAFELAVYGTMTGFLYRRLARNISGIYLSLVGAMVAGRVVWGIVKALMTLTGNSTFTFAAFISGALTTAIPGILLQLVLVPAIICALQKSGFLTVE